MRAYGRLALACNVDGSRKELWIYVRNGSYVYTDASSDEDAYPELAYRDDYLRVLHSSLITHRSSLDSISRDDLFIELNLAHDK